MNKWIILLILLIATFSFLTSKYDETTSKNLNNGANEYVIGKNSEIHQKISSLTSETEPKS